MALQAPFTGQGHLDSAHTGAVHQGECDVDVIDEIAVGARGFEPETHAHVDQGVVVPVRTPGTADVHEPGQRDPQYAEEVEVGVVPLFRAQPELPGAGLVAVGIAAQTRTTADQHLLVGGERIGQRGLGVEDQREPWRLAVAVSRPCGGDHVLGHGGLGIPVARGACAVAQDAVVADPAAVPKFRAGDDMAVFARRVTEQRVVLAPQVDVLRGLHAVHVAGLGVFVLNALIGDPRIEELAALQREIRARGRR